LTATARSDVRDFLNRKFAIDFFKRYVFAGDGGDGGQEITDCRIRPLKLSKRGGKSVIDFTLHLRQRGRQISKSVVCKWRPDGRGMQSFRLLRELWSKGFDGTDDLMIPEPIAYFPVIKLLITARAKGFELAHTLGMRPKKAVRFSIVQASNWLTKLHGTRIDWVRGRSLEEEKRVLRRWGVQLGRLHPTARERLHRILLVALEEEKSVSPERFLLTHGDFHQANIFVDKTHFSVIDFDQSCYFDPASDLGYFIAQLNIRKKRYRLRFDSEGLEDLFLGEYMRTASPQINKRVPIYEARAYLQHLFFDYCILNREIDAAEFDYWVRRSEQCLQTGGVMNG